MENIDLKLLNYLHCKDDFVSGEKISVELGVSRTTIWKHIESLRKKGYVIESSTNKGYKILRVPDKIIPEEVYLGLNTNYLGKEIIVFPSIESTNEKAKELAREGAASGTVVVAEEQTLGKGRMGRKWFSPQGTGLWFSIIVRPEILPNKAPFLTIVAALAVAEGLKSLQLDPIIKWPNDILLADKKVCGILSELNSDLEMIKYAIIGIGLNVNQEYFPEELTEKATSLRIILETKVNRTNLLKQILYSFEKYYKKLLQGEFSELINEWRKGLNIVDKLVTIYSGNNIYHGKVLDVSSQGELIIKDEDEKIRSFWAGDVTLRKGI